MTTNRPAITIVHASDFQHATICLHLCCNALEPFESVLRALRFEHLLWVVMAVAHKDDAPAADCLRVLLLIMRCFESMLHAIYRTEADLEKSEKTARDEMWSFCVLCKVDRVTVDFEQEDQRR